MKYLFLALFFLSCTPQPAMPKNCRFQGIDRSWVCTGHRYDFILLPHPSGAKRPAGRVLQSVDGKQMPIIIEAMELPKCATSPEAP